MATFKSCGWSSGRRCKTMNYSKTLLCSCFQPCAKGDEALPDQWKFLFTCRSIRSGTLLTIWTFEMQTSNPPFFSRPAVRALSVILSELCLSVQSVAATWPSLHNALREEEAATGWRVCQTLISQHQVPWGLFASGVNAGQSLFMTLWRSRRCDEVKSFLIFHSSLCLWFFLHFWHL